MIFANEISGAYKDGDKIVTLQGNSIYYTEQLADFKFTVSPFSFFQVNIPVFEKMLIEIASFLNMDREKTTILDICCGTGAIGICMSKWAKKVVGIELVEAAVDNAKLNVEEMNKDKIEAGKCEFHAGRAEVLLPEISK